MPESPIQYRPLTDDLRQGVTWRSLKYFGAGAIVASVTIGSGETVFASRGGAVFGYTILWCFVASAVMKGIQVYGASRYMVLTGEHPMTHWAYLPGPKNWVPLTMAVLSLICFPFWQAALPLVLGKDIINWIFNIQGSQEQLLRMARIWATLAILSVVVLMWLQTYELLEKSQVIIVGLLLSCLLAAVIAAKPDWYAALLGAFTPRVPKYEPWIAEKFTEIAKRPPWVEMVTYLGAIGGGTYDYLGYVGCLREKSWGALGTAHDRYQIATQAPARPIAVDLSAENLDRGRRWLIPVQIDTFVGFASVLVFAVCFVVLGARILHPQQLVPEDQNLLGQQAAFLTSMHPSLLYVYQVGIFMAFFGTIYGAYEIYFRTAFECLLPISARLRTVPFNTFRRGMVIYCASFGLLFLWTMDNPVKMITPAAILGGVFTCGLWCLAMLWSDRHFLPDQLRMPPLLRVLTFISGVVLTTLGTKALWDYAQDLLSV